MSLLPGKASPCSMGWYQLRQVAAFQMSKPAVQVHACLLLMYSILIPLRNQGPAVLQRLEGSRSRLA